MRKSKQKSRSEALTKVKIGRGTSSLTAPCRADRRGNGLNRQPGGNLARPEPPRPSHDTQPRASDVLTEFELKYRGPDEVSAALRIPNSSESGWTLRWRRANSTRARSAVLSNAASHTAGSQQTRVGAPCVRVWAFFAAARSAALSFDVANSSALVSGSKRNARRSSGLPKPKASPSSPSSSRLRPARARTRSIDTLSSQPPSPRPAQPNAPSWFRSWTGFHAMSRSSQV